MTEAPRVREARPDDAPAVARLLDELGHPAPADEVRARLADLARRPEHVVLVVEDASGVVAAASAFVSPVLHRPGLTGRISVMVVAARTRGTGVGTRLLAATEEALAARGATRFELTSNVRRVEAHGFYERRGYERQGFRFAKSGGGRVTAPSERTRRRRSAGPALRRR